jgi:hypothetical protein
MQPRPVIALCVHQVIFALFQWLSYSMYGLAALVGAWSVVVIVTWIETRGASFKVGQTVVQTAWFVFMIGGVHMGQLRL